MPTIKRALLNQTKDSSSPASRSGQPVPPGTGGGYNAHPQLWFPSSCYAVVYCLLIWRIHTAIVVIAIDGSNFHDRKINNQGNTSELKTINCLVAIFYTTGTQENKL